MLENSGRTEINMLGEFGLIKHITQFVSLKNEHSIKGIGDDAAVIDAKGKKTLVSTDMLVEGIHFDLAYVPLKHLGYKAVVVNLSDICAMNAKPAQVLVSIAISNRFSLEAIEELYSGIMLACERYQVDLIGGDTSSSDSGLIISITAIGYAQEDDICYRNLAKPNQLICITGDIGGAYMGLQVLQREKAIFEENPNLQPDLEGNDYILERQLKPEARIDLYPMLKALKIKPYAMIDVSDGLASELFHICTQSNVGCTIFEEKLPIDPTTYQSARDFNLDPTLCMLSGGEDYELLFTVDLEAAEKLQDNPDITIIGHTTEFNSGMNLITKNGLSAPLKAQGWDAFRK